MRPQSTEPEVAGQWWTPLVTRAGGGKPWIYVDRVSQPTMTVIRRRDATRACRRGVPGGGYNILAIDLEGTEVWIG